MEIQSLQDYINIIEKLKTNYTYSTQEYANPLIPVQTCTPKFIYRGQGNYADKILPGILRWKKTDNGASTTQYSQMEFNVLSDFISEACRFIKDVPTGDTVAWLEIAQHFGVPTRLLDFTENPLVALYFACSDLQDTQALVCVLNEPQYNKIFFNESHLIEPVKSQSIVAKIIDDEIVQRDYSLHNNANYMEYPWIYKPYYYEERMNLQSSIFMLWGADQRALNEFMCPHNYMSDADQVENKETGVICDILIPGNMKRDLIAQLDLYGINEKMIYPGLDGVGRYIRQKYSYKAK